MLRAVITILTLCEIVHAASTNVKDMVLEYKRSANGAYTAVIHNHHPTAATAYVADAYYDGGTRREQRTVFGGDALGHPDGGGIEVHPGDQEMGYALPGGASATSTGFSAAIYADGYTEGNEDIISMLLSGRERSYADLKQLLPQLDKFANKQIGQDDLMKALEAMLAQDKEEARDLDSIVARSGLKYQFFVGAVPAQAIEKLQAGAAANLAAEFRAWFKKLEDSKPSLK